jgi:flavin-dependent dehydrogenase
MSSHDVDLLIIGAGPSGTVAAGTARRAGLSVRIVEKEVFPRFVIGESLLPRCMEALEAAGLLEAATAYGFQEKFGAKFLRGDEVSDFSFAEKFTKGFDHTWQVPRADFDKLLAEEVARKGVRVDFATEVIDVVFDGTSSRTTVRPRDGAEEIIRARFLIDASGYGRVLPKLFGLDKPSNLPPRKTIFGHFHDPRRAAVHEPNRIQIITHTKTVWAWVIPFSNGLTSVGFVGSPSDFEGLPDDLEAALRTLIEREPNTRDRFRDTDVRLGPKTLAGWSVTTERFHGPGFVLTGNVTEFLDPIFSSGVTLATVSGQRAGALAAEQVAGRAVDWDEEFVKPTMQGVDTFRSYVMAWYDGSLQDVIYAKAPDPDVKRMICSVLAGYVWDLENPFVRRHGAAIGAVARAVRMRE